MQGSVKKGLRHHCRKCGGVVCTDCYSHKQKLKVYVDRDDSVKVWMAPSKTIQPPAFTICKRCHTQSMEELRSTKLLSQKKPHVFCQICSLPCMKKTIADETRFDTELVVVPETLFGLDPVVQGGNIDTTEVLCHYCRFARPVRRGGLNLYTILVSGLSCDVLEEDVHAAFEDRFKYIFDVKIPKDEDGFNVIDLKDGTTHAIVRFYSHGKYVSPSIQDPHGILEGFDGALAVKTCNVQMSEEKNTTGHIHRIKWGKMQYQSVTPCLIRRSPHYSLKKNTLLYNDNRHMSEERKTTESIARRKLKEKTRMKNLNIYNATIKELQHPKIMPTAFNPKSQAGLANQAYNAVKLGNRKALEMVIKSNNIVSETSMTGNPMFHLYNERYEGGATLLHLAALSGNLSVVSLLINEKVVGDLAEINNRIDAAKEKKKRDNKS